MVLIGFNSPGRTEDIFKGIPKWFFGQVVFVRARRLRRQGQTTTRFRKMGGFVGPGAPGLQKTAWPTKTLRFEYM